MVDAAAAVPPPRPAGHDGSAPPPTASPGDAFAVEVEAAGEAALAEYEAFCRAGVHGPAQHPVWVRAWIEATEADVLVVTVRRGGLPAFKLALEIVARGPFRIARFVGGSHANGNFAALAPGMAAAASRTEGKALAAALRRVRPDVDLLFLSRQNPDFHGVGNPLAGLATMESPNLSLAARLDGGFEALLERAGRRRKLRHYKQRLSRFRQSGGFQLIEAGTAQEVERLLDAFFVMKGERLRRMGIANVFMAPELQTFFRTLFLAALEIAPTPFVLHGLEVGGRIVAVNGLSVTGHSLVWEFGGIDDSDPAASPGYFLNHHSIEWACRLGKDIYDFSVGDEPFKRSWADVETRQFETLVPLGVRGHGLALYERGRAAAVRRVKSNPRLWEMARRLRGRLGGAAQRAPARHDPD